jgi:hypothetical protein
MYVSKTVRIAKAELRPVDKQTGPEAEELARVFSALQAELADLRKLLKIAGGAEAQPAANK